MTQTDMERIQKGFARFAKALNSTPREIRRRIDPDVIQRIHEMAGEGYTGPAIERVLSADPEYADRTPSLRTIQDVARDTPEVTEWWSVAEADPTEARLVLPVLAERTRYLRTLHHTTEPVRIARDLGRWIAKVRAIEPALPPREAYRLAWRYWVNPSPELDAYLALREWEVEG